MIPLGRGEKKVCKYSIYWSGVGSGDTYILWREVRGMGWVWVWGVVWRWCFGYLISKMDDGKSNAMRGGVGLFGWVA